MKNIFMSFVAITLLSCNKDNTIKSPKGGIDVITNVYFNASKGLEDTKQFHVSKINYLGDDIVELVPNIEFPEIIDSVYYIKENTFYRVGTPEESKSLIFREFEMTAKKEDLLKKNYGAVWLNIPIFDYEKRTDIADTTLYNNKHYKRFQINTKENYTVFYVHLTDTILPYSLNRQAEKDYKGRIERIDSYDKTKDLFATMWLIPRKSMDDEAKEIFEYNTYIEAEFQTKKNKLKQ